MWTARDIRRTYGLDDETAKDIDSGKKEDITKIVIGIFDQNGDEMISREEWMDGWMKEGKRLPDFGVRPPYHIIRGCGGNVGVFSAAAICLGATVTLKRGEFEPFLSVRDWRALKGIMINFTIVAHLLIKC